MKSFVLLFPSSVSISGITVFSINLSKYSKNSYSEIASSPSASISLNTFSIFSGVLNYLVKLKMSSATAMNLSPLYIFMAWSGYSDKKCWWIAFRTDYRLSGLSEVGRSCLNSSNSNLSFSSLWLAQIFILILYLLFLLKLIWM